MFKVWTANKLYNYYFYVVKLSCIIARLPNFDISCSLKVVAKKAVIFVFLLDTVLPFNNKKHNQLS